MNKVIKLIIVACLIALPVIAFAAPTSVNRVTDHIEPLIRTDYIKAQNFVASSTGTGLILDNDGEQATFAWDGALTDLTIDGSSGITDLYFNTGILHLQNGLLQIGTINPSTYENTFISDANQFSLNAPSVYLSALGAGALSEDIHFTALSSNSVDVNSTTGANTLNFDFGTTTFTGNVGVGTTTPYSKLSVNNGSTITVGNPASGTIVQDNDVSYQLQAYGNSYEFYVYAYNTEGSNTAYSATPLALVETDDGTSDPFRWDLSWSAVTGADGYIVLVGNDDYNGFYGDVYLDTTSTSATYDGPYGSWINNVPTVTPTSPYTALGDGLAVVGNADIYGTLDVDGNAEFNGLTKVFKNYGGYTGANDLGNVLFGKADGTVKLRFDWHDTFGTFVDIRNGVSTSAWVGEITYTNPSSTFGDDRLALFQVRTSPSSNGGGQFFLVTHSATANNFNYITQMYENGAITLGSAGGNDASFTAPSSKVWLRGNVAVGATAGTTVAPTNGLYVQGRVGIGTTTPLAALGISTSTQQSGLIPMLTVASTTNKTLFTVLGNGNVGVGTTTPSSNLEVSGSFGCTTRPITTTATLGATDCNVYIPSWVTSSFTVNLPTVSNVVREYTVSNMGTGDITLDGNSSEPVHGSTTFILGAQESATIYSTASTTQGWIIK